MNYNFLGKFIYYFFPYRKKVIKKNLGIVFQNTLSIKEAKIFIQDVYAYYIRTIILIFRTYFFYERALKIPIKFVGEENIVNAYNKKKGVILLCGHTGYFQWSLIKTIKRFLYLGKFFVVLKNIRISCLEKIFYFGIKKSSAEIISSKGAFRKIYSVLKNAEIVFFTFDQHAVLKNKEGVVVDFFGKKASTFSSLSVLAKKTQAKVIPVACYFSQSLNANIVEFLPEVEWKVASTKEDELIINTREYNKALEQIILKSPKQWMWTHKRWKIDENLYN